jgi:transcriptional regulator with XRE-family HTH domain
MSDRRANRVDAPIDVSRARLVRRGQVRSLHLTLRAMRDAAGLTQAQVEKRSGLKLKQPEISKLEAESSLDERQVSTIRRGPVDLPVIAGGKVFPGRSSDSTNERAHKALLGGGQIRRHRDIERYIESMLGCREAPWGLCGCGSPHLRARGTSDRGRTRARQDARERD